jgi:hypothetical protein
MQLPEAAAELSSIYLHVLRGKRVLLLFDNAVDGDRWRRCCPPRIARSS